MSLILQWLLIEALKIRCCRKLNSWNCLSRNWRQAEFSFLQLLPSELANEMFGLRCFELMMLLPFYTHSSTKRSCAALLWYSLSRFMSSACPEKRFWRTVMLSNKLWPEISLPCLLYFIPGILLPATQALDKSFHLHGMIHFNGVKCWSLKVNITKS